MSIAARDGRAGTPLGATALFLLLAAGPAIAVECGDVITTPTVLDRDLVCTTEPGLTLEGSTLDLNDFTLVCNQTSVGILLEGTGARLRNGAVTGCEVAVWIGGLGDHRVRQVSASASNQGVFVESDDNLLALSHVLRGLADAAVQVDGSNNRLRFNDIGGSDDQGFEINGNNNRIIGNRIGGVAEGVQLTGEGNRVHFNDIFGTAERGIEVREGAHRIAGNRIADGVLDGVAVFSDGNRVLDNVIVGHGDQGLFVSGTGNILSGNLVRLNGVDLTDTNPACDNNLWQGNDFETSDSDDCVD